MRIPLFSSVVLFLSLAACSSLPKVTVAGKTLSISETDFGMGTYFCGNLENGQYLVIMTDFGLYSELQAGDSQQLIFHGYEETNLQLVFPQDISKAQSASTFTVGYTNCVDQSGDGVEAMAYFNHNSARQATYDVHNQATLGTITARYREASAKELDGSFDLMFGTDHARGSFTALYVTAITPPFGS